MDPITWYEAEWNDKAFMASHKGYELSVQPPDAGYEWFWVVRTTSETSEYPEIIDCGEQATEQLAKGAAETCAVKYGEGRG